MITGFVNARLEPMIRLIVRDIAGIDHDIETMIDTGFGGALTLPPSVIAAFGLPWSVRSTVILGDGSVVHADVYGAIVIWDGVVRHIDVDAAATHPLLGLKLLVGNRVQLDVLDGGPVTIEALPVT